MGIITPNGNHYYRTDSNDVISLLDATSKELKSHKYNAYGEKYSISINPNCYNTILYQRKMGTDDIYNPFGYCGEYFDNESGLIYLRNRYYNPVDGRFMTEDPVRDGLNWYVYCANNPIRYKDPRGLAITCDEKNSERIISLLREISGNSLGFEYNDGQINITKTYDTNHHVGQTLVYDLITSSETVNIRFGLDNMGLTNRTLPAYEKKPIRIYIDPNNDTGKGIFTTFTQDANGNDLEETAPAYIIFGHELIHSWRTIKGFELLKGGKNVFIPKDALLDWPEEELQTMGINYTDVNGNLLRN